MQMLEVLLIACAIAYASGTQTEAAQVGLSPADRALRKQEQSHNKALQKIADKHGVEIADSSGAIKAAPMSPGLTTTPADGNSPMAAPESLPAAFKSGYRTYAPATYAGRPVAWRAGEWTARGLGWAKDTGRSALRRHRERRQAAGEPDPAPIVVPPPPDYPPDVPAVSEGPGSPDTGAGATGGEAGPDDTAVTEPAAASDARATPPKSLLEALAGSVTAAHDPVPAASDSSTETPATETKEKPEERAAEAPATESASDVTEPEPPVTASEEAVTEPQEAVTGTEEAVTPPASPKASRPEEAVSAASEPLAPSESSSLGEAATDAGPKVDLIKHSDPVTGSAHEEGVGRMAAEVTYDSVLEESDELSAMCEEDLTVGKRIEQRAEREIARGDQLIADLKAVGIQKGFFFRLVVSAIDHYRGIHGHLDALQTHTLAQHERVAAAKSLLEAGQGVYARTGKDMEEVAEREHYVNDAVDQEDLDAHTEHYETTGSAA